MLRDGMLALVILDLKPSNTLPQQQKAQGWLAYPKGPITMQCEACGRAKARRIIWREERNIIERPGMHLAIDFHDF